MAEQVEKLRVAQLQRQKRRGRFGLRRASGGTETRLAEGRAISLDLMRGER